jgi:hypothetical protein
MARDALGAMDVVHHFCHDAGFAVSRACATKIEQALALYFKKRSAKYHDDRAAGGRSVRPNVSTFGFELWKGGRPRYDRRFGPASSHAAERSRYRKSIRIKMDPGSYVSLDLGGGRDAKRKDELGRRGRSRRARHVQR